MRKKKNDSYGYYSGECNPGSDNSYSWSGLENVQAYDYTGFETPSYSRKKNFDISEYFWIVKLAIVIILVLVIGSIVLSMIRGAGSNVPEITIKREGGLATSEHANLGSQLDQETDVTDAEIRTEASETGGDSIVETVQENSLIEEETLDSEDVHLSDYMRVYNAITQYRGSVQLEAKSSDEASRLYRIVRQDHPELFWGIDVYTLESVGRQSLLIKPVRTKAEIDRQRQKLEEAVLAAFSGIRADMTEYDIALYFHDYLANHIYYDYEAYEEWIVNNNQITGNAANAYGALVEGKAVCQGYASAFQLLLQRAGIECGMISGYSRKSQEPHAWNYICIGGNHFHVDVTWDDLDMQGDASAIRYTYFCLPDERMSLTHTVGDNLQEIPACTSDALNYFKINGCWIEQYSIEAVRDCLDSRVNESVVEIAFASKEEYELAYSKLINEGEVWKIDRMNQDGSFSYSTDDDNYILRFIFE